MFATCHLVIIDAKHYLTSHIIDSAGSVETLPTCPYQGRQYMEGVVPLKVGQPLFAKKSNINLI